jgi:hypothetical protein
MKIAAVFWDVPLSLTVPTSESQDCGPDICSLSCEVYTLSTNLSHLNMASDIQGNEDI